MELCQVVFASFSVCDFGCVKLRLQAYLGFKGVACGRCSQGAPEVQAHAQVRICGWRHGEAQAQVQL